MPIYGTGWLAGYLSIFLCLFATFRPRFRSDYLAPSATALSKRSTMVQMFSLTNILNCLPPLICVIKHICTRLTHKLVLLEYCTQPIFCDIDAITDQLINIMLVDFHHLLLFRFPLFHTLKFVIHYFQFVNFTYLFQPCYSPLADPAKLEYSVLTRWPAD